MQRMQRAVCILIRLCVCVCVGTYNNNNNTVLPYEVMVVVVQLGSYGSYDCSASGVKSKVGWVVEKTWDGTRGVYGW